MDSNGKKFWKISLWVALCVFVVTCYKNANLTELITNKHFDIQNLKPLFGYIEESITITVFIMFAFNYFLWKIKPINFITGQNPILENYYNGYIEYVYTNDGKTKKKKVIVKVKQTYLSCDFQLFSDESDSTTIHSFIKEINNEKELVYVYFNVPKPEFRKKSQMHRGTAILKVRENIIEGEYYTDRKSQGTLHLYPKSK